MFAGTWVIWSFYLVSIATATDWTSAVKNWWIALHSGPYPFNRCYSSGLNYSLVEGGGGFMKFIRYLWISQSSWSFQNSGGLSLILYNMQWAISGNEETPVVQLPTTWVGNFSGTVFMSHHPGRDGTLWWCSCLNHPYSCGPIKLIGSPNLDLRWNCFFGLSLTSLSGVNTNSLLKKTMLPWPKGHELVGAKHCLWS